MGISTFKSIMSQELQINNNFGVDIVSLFILMKRKLKKVVSLWRYYTILSP